MRRVLRALALVLIVVVCAVAAAAWWVAAPVEQLRGTYVYLPAGAKTTRAAGLGVSTNVGLGDVPELLLLSLLFNEDKKFFEHHGFDLTEIANSVRDWASRGRRLRGASTITQQLARTLFAGPGRTLPRKLVEAVDTVRLEHAFTKDEILLMYLNSVEWGRGVHGVAEASARYFKKAPADLEPMECVFLAAIIPSPRRLTTSADAWEVRPATAVRMRRLFEGVRAAMNAVSNGAGATSRDPGVRLVGAVRAARERAESRQVTR